MKHNQVLENPRIYVGFQELLLPLSPIACKLVMNVTCVTISNTMKANTRAMTPTQMQNPCNYKNSKGGEELQKHTRNQRHYMDHNK
jgi:hypothetical protein